MYDPTDAQTYLSPDVHAVLDQFTAGGWNTSQAIEIVVGGTRLSAAALPPASGDARRCTWCLFVRDRRAVVSALDGWTLELELADGERHSGRFDRRAALTIGELPLEMSFRAALHAPASNVVSFPQRAAAARGQLNAAMADAFRQIRTREPMPSLTLPMRGERLAAAIPTKPRSGRGLSLQLTRQHDWEGHALDVTVRALDGPRWAGGLARVRVRLLDDLEGGTLLYLPLDRDGQRTARVRGEDEASFDGATIAIEELLTLDDAVDDSREAELLTQALPASRAAIESDTVWQPILAALRAANDPTLAGDDGEGQNGRS